MSTPDAANWQDDQPLDSAPGGWGETATGAFDDPTGNFFSAEIENVSPSDWNDDTSRIWDDSHIDVADDHSAIGGLDFSL